MTGFSFPIFPTKVAGATQSFKLEDPVERRKYFTAKVGSEIERIKGYLDRGDTFFAFLLGPKNSGKGTYTKLFMEAVGSERVAHLSVGDIVRAAQAALRNTPQKEELRRYLGRTYRGFTDLDAALNQVLNWDVRVPLPTEVILALVQRETERLERKAIFLDGFPRNLDQVSYSLYLRSVMGFRDDPDFFVFIDVPEPVIHERMQGRVVCPVCHTPRGLKLLRTKDIGYDQGTGEFYLICDNAGCGGARLVAKEGDEFGIEAIRERMEVDRAVMRRLRDLHGVPKVYLRNAIPVSEASATVDPYEITPAYRYAWDATKGEVRVIEEPWVVPDDDGVPSHSLLPGAVVVSLIKQVAAVLGV